MQIFIKSLIVLLSLIAIPAWATYPDKPVKIVVSLPAGSGPDVQLRRLSEMLSEKWKQPVIVENRPGGSGLVAISRLTKEPADGYTIAMFAVTDIIAFPILHNKENLLNGIELIAPFFTADMALFTTPGISNLKELEREMQKNPTYGSWGIGTIGHVTGAEFASMYGKNFTHVPYKEYAPWYIDTHNRNLSFGFTSLGSGNAMYRSGKIHYLAIAAETRNKKFPDVPTIKEVTGKSIISISAWLAFFVRKDMPDSIKQQLEKDIRAAISDQKIQNSLEENYFIPINTLSRDAFRKQIENDQLNYANMIKKYNIDIK